MKTKMNNKTVLITGSSSGIGEVMAKSFLTDGYSVIFHGIDESVCVVAEKYSIIYDKPLLAVQANLCHKEDMDKMMETIFSRYPSIDILVNNAGMQHVCPVEDFPLEKWSQVLALNLTAPFYLSQKVWTSMKKNNFGRIINISSIHGVRASEFKSAYVSAKHGLNGLTKTLALEGAPYNITVNAICPGYVKTALVDGQIDDQARVHNMPKEKVIAEVILAKQAVKKFVEPESIAELALFLSQESSGQMTGSEIIIDGGWSAK